MKEIPSAGPNSNVLPVPEKSPPKGRTLAFLQAAITEGAHLKKPEGRNLSDAGRVRQGNVVAIYYGSPVALEDLRGFVRTSRKKIARDKETEREAVRQLRNRGIRNLWRNCSAKTQQNFPLSEIQCAKPLPQRSKEKRSSDRGGRSAEVAILLNAGKSPKEIMEEAGLTVRQLGTARLTLRRWGGLEVPYLHTSSLENKKLAADLKAATDDLKIQKLFARVKMRFCQEYSKGENPVLVSLRRVLSTAGFHCYTTRFRLFKNSLKEAGIPVGEVKHRVKSDGKIVIRPYTFIVAQHRDRAIDTFLGDESLKQFLENPVSQVCGPEIGIPTITQLGKCDLYRPTAPIFAGLGISFGGRPNSSRLKRGDFFTPDCPVAIFRTRSNSRFFYPAGCEDKLRTFLEERLGKLLQPT